MKKAIARITRILALLALAASPALASFDNQFTTVRSAAMGSGSMGSIGEAGSLFANPAGMAYMPGSELSLMYDKLYAGLPDVGNMGVGYIALGVPTRYGTVGVGLGDFMASGLKEERTIGLSYAQSILSGLQLGFTAKQLYHSYNTNGDAYAAKDPVFANGTSKSAVAFDAGLVASIMGPMKFGLSVQNINRPDVGLASQDRVPRQVQGGLIFDFAGMGLRATGDMNYRDASVVGQQSNVMPVLGLEKFIYSGPRTNFAMRAGLNPNQISGGLGMNMGRIGFDYAFAISRQLTSDNFGSHQVGMNYHFGQGTGAAVTDSESLHRGISKDDEFDYLNLDNKALFGR